MKRALLACLLFVSVTVHSQSQLSDQSQISLITLGPDQDDLVQAFGHSAIRVSDPVRGIDLAYNYGVFSFNQPNFYLNFARGHNYYYLGIASYPEFKDIYIYYNRYVHEQILDLTPDQRQRVFEYLQKNALPENRSYLYDYFFNNCSTKIRDVLAEVLGSDVAFDKTRTTGSSIRELTDPYLKYIPWGDLGIDIGLGSLIDREATAYESMYLPEYLETGFDHATLKSDDSSRPLVKTKNIVYAAQPAAPHHSLIHPWIAFGALFALALILTILDFRRKKISVWFDSILFIVTGIVGLVALLLWTATDHHACAKNYNLLWALPTHLVAVFFIFRMEKPRWLKVYFMISAAICLLLLLLWPVLPQLLNRFLIPVVGALLLRSVTNFKLPSVASGS